MNDKLNSILNLFRNSQCISIQGDNVTSPLLHSVSIAERKGTPENEVILATWNDDEYGYSVKFSEAGLAQAKLNPSGLLELPDSEGDICFVGFYSLENALAGVCQNDLEEGKI